MTVVPVLVTSRAGLDAAMERLRSAERVAADTEGNSMHAYQGRLCVVQLAVAWPDRAADEIFLIDALAVGDLAPLGAILGPDGPPTIFHDVGYDARMLGAMSVPVGGVIDTALHARMLGLRETGLASLLQARFGIHVSKSMQQHDWARRPLDARAIQYLAGDVAQLGRLACELESEVEAKGIVDEVREETAWVLAQAAAVESDVRPPWAKVKGVRSLAPEVRAVLRELAIVREAWAEGADRPPGMVISGADLVGIAMARPREASAIRRSHGGAPLPDALAREMLAAVLRGMTEGDVPEQERQWLAPERSSGESSGRRSREAALSAWRTAEATRRGVDLQVVLPGHALTALAAVGAVDEAALDGIDGLGPHRRARYGAHLIQVLRTVR